MVAAWPGSGCGAVNQETWEANDLKGGGHRNAVWGANRNQGCAMSTVPPLSHVHSPDTKPFPTKENKDLLGETSKAWKGFRPVRHST